MVTGCHGKMNPSVEGQRRSPIIGKELNLSFVGKRRRALLGAASVGRQLPHEPL